MSFILNTFTINANVPTSHKAPETTLAKKNVIISIINALEELSDISDEYVSVVDKLKENPNDYDAIEEYLSVIIKLAKLVEKYENEDYSKHCH